MPLVSKAQQGFMFANHPKIAKKWAKMTPDMKDLPEHVEKKAKESATDASHTPVPSKGSIKGIAKNTGKTVSEQPEDFTKVAPGIEVGGIGVENKEPKKKETEDYGEAKNNEKEKDSEAKEPSDRGIIAGADASTATMAGGYETTITDNDAKGGKKKEKKEMPQPVKEAMIKTAGRLLAIRFMEKLAAGHGFTGNLTDDVQISNARKGLPRPEQNGPTRSYIMSNMPGASSGAIPLPGPEGYTGMNKVKDVGMRGINRGIQVAKDHPYAAAGVGTVGLAAALYGAHELLTHRDKAASTARTMAPLYGAYNIIVNRREKEAGVGDDLKNAGRRTISSVKHKAIDVGKSVSETAKGVGRSAKETGKNLEMAGRRAVSSVKHNAIDAGNSVSETTRNAGRRLGEAGHDALMASRRAKESIKSVARGAAETAGEAVKDVGPVGRSIGNYASTHPVAAGLGGVGLAASLYGAHKLLSNHRKQQ